MSTSFLSAAEVRAGLEALTHAQCQQLAETSGVPFTTLWKVRSGETANPGIETVRKFFEHIVAPDDRKEDLGASARQQAPPLVDKAAKRTRRAA